jgi:hypothetical protein
MPGIYSFTAVYSGDSNYAGSTSPAVSVTLGKVLGIVTVTPASYTILSNQSLQLTITVAQVNGFPMPTGAVTVSYNGNSGVFLPAVNVVNGTATVTIPANSLWAGNDTITASYSGDTDYQQYSGTTFVTVNPSGTITPTVTVTGPTGAVAYPVSITVLVSGPSGDPTPTGLVTLSSAGGAFGPQSAQLTNGQATFTIPYELLGTQVTLTATYPGDSNYTKGSGTGGFTAFLAPTISFSQANPNIVVNQPLIIQITVSNPTNALWATGTITLSSGTYNSGPIQLSSGNIFFTIPANSLAVGTDTLTASYSGDSRFLAGANAETVTVTEAPSLTMVGTAVSVSPGATTANTSTITLTPGGGFTGSVTLTTAIATSPTGAVDLPTLSFGSTSPASITGVNPATATLTVSTTAPTTAALTHPSRPGVPWYLAGGATLACLLILGIPARRRIWRTILGMLLFLVFLTGGVLSCGGAGSGSGGGGGGGGQSNPGTTPGTYTIAITGTNSAGAGITATGTITLTVQ